MSWDIIEAGYGHVAQYGQSGGDVRLVVSETFWLIQSPQVAGSNPAMATMLFNILS